MEKNKNLEFLKNLGFSSYSLFDVDGFAIVEEGLLPEQTGDVSEQLSGLLSKENSGVEYFIWQQDAQKMFSTLIDENYLLVGMLERNTPFTKIIYFLDTIITECNQFLDEI